MGGISFYWSFCLLDISIISSREVVEEILFRVVVSEVSSFIITGQSFMVTVISLVIGGVIIFILVLPCYTGVCLYIRWSIYLAVLVFYFGLLLWWRDLHFVV